MQQIADWLEKLGMSEYAQRFAENGIDVSVLRYLTDRDLEKIGVLLGHRRSATARGRAHHRFGDRPSWPPSMRSALEDPSRVGPGPGSSYSARIHIHTRAPRAGVGAKSARNLINGEPRAFLNLYKTAHSDRRWISGITRVYLAWKSRRRSRKTPTITKTKIAHSTNSILCSCNTFSSPRSVSQAAAALIICSSVYIAMRSGARGAWLALTMSATIPSPKRSKISRELLRMSASRTFRHQGSVSDISIFLWARCIAVHVAYPRHVTDFGGLGRVEGLG